MAAPSAGKIMSYISYDDWGELTMKAVLRFTQGNRELDLVQEYTVHPYDQVLRLYYAKARMYDAAGRRFAAGDPAEIALNLYLYCFANPVTLIDYTGLLAVNGKEINQLQQDGKTYLLLSELASVLNGSFTNNHRLQSEWVYQYIK